MATRTFASFVVLCSAIGLSPGLAVEPPQMGSGPFADGKVIQAVGSGTVASRVLRQASLESTREQIRFDIQILDVDPATREKIYQILGSESVNTTISKVGEESPVIDQDTSKSQRASRRSMSTGSIVSTAVMSREQTQKIAALVNNSPTCKVIARPTIIATDGQVAAIEQRVQRPFLTDLQKVSQGDHSAVQSSIQVFDEGLEFVVEARSEGTGLKVHGKLEQARVAKVDQHRVYGFGDENISVQVPSHEVRTASGRELLHPTQSMLMDPYFESTRLVAENTEAKMLEGVPYVSEMFESTTTKEVKSNMMILMTAKKVPARSKADAK